MESNEDHTQKTIRTDCVSSPHGTGMKRQRLFSPNPPVTLTVVFLSFASLYFSGIHFQVQRNATKCWCDLFNGLLLLANWSHFKLKEDNYLALTIMGILWTVTQAHGWTFGFSVWSLFLLALLFKHVVTKEPPTTAYLARYVWTPSKKKSFCFKFGHVVHWQLLFYRF